jgi:hypothetical protein
MRGIAIAPGADLTPGREAAGNAKSERQTARMKM